MGQKFNIILSASWILTRQHKCVDGYMDISAYTALFWHFFAHRLYKAGWPTLARRVALHSRHVTGIEIHPGATIGRGLFIDHGMGVVIGETAIVGDNMTLFHQVNIGWHVL